MSQTKLLHTKIGYSRKLAFWIIAIYVGLIIACLSLPLSWHVSLSVILFSGVRSLYGFFKNVWRNHPRAIVAISQLDDDNWELVTRKGERLTGQIKGDSFISPLMLSLHFKVTERWFRVHVVIFNDAVPKKEFRRLRVYLKS